VSSADVFTKLRFIFVGRLTKEKGVDRILTFFSQRNDVLLTIVGDGDMRSLVQQYEKLNANIEYRGYISDQQELARIYREHHFLLLPSIKRPTFVELFGMVVIEAMACGLVPICTKHPGPLEVIINNVDGYLMDEINIEEDIESIIHNYNENSYAETQLNAINKANTFTLEEISKRWEILVAKLIARN
jgi:glycosyltransferase involved in cell wall biosynthesis